MLLLMTEKTVCSKLPLENKVETMKQKQMLAVI